MTQKPLLKTILTSAILICTQTTAWALNNNLPFVQEDVILQWNRVLMETVRTPEQQPATIMPVRSYAIMHAAMFDAVNSIDGSYTSYLTDVLGSPNASVEAAAARRKRLTTFSWVCIRRVQESSTRNSRSRFRESMRIERNKEFVSVKSSPSGCLRHARMTAGT